jgi:predicted ATPase/transcriptional regulator with XRE-family HTH domain
MSAEGSPLAQLLRRQRAAAGLTQEELAERAGVSVRTISDVERGLRKTIYRHTAEVLAAALGLDEAGRAKFEEAARGSARRGPRQVPASTLPIDRWALRLPGPPTGLIGRERELEVVSRALADGGIRLLTLTGPGGIGKTRIAIEAARREQEHGADRVFFVPLGGIADPGLVASTVAMAIGVTSATEPIEEAIAEHLGDAGALLVLDTFEHLLGAAPFVASLVARCGVLKVLVTTREVLHLSGEHEVVVPALEVPTHPWASPADDVSRSAATELFIQRAVAAKSDFVLDDRSALLVREVCATLDGLPLAIELAASRVKHLSLEALRKKLDSRLSVLTGGPRDLPRRQQTMRDTIAWSYELLAPEEQALFRSLSVFAGGWTLEAAASVCGIAETGPDPLQLMSALVDKSLVYLIDTGSADVRYSMFDVIREFAVERSEAAERNPLRQRHAEFSLGLAERAEPELGRSDQRLWYRRLDIEHDNFRSALGWLIRTGDAERALRLAGALWQFWRRQGYLTEGRMWLRETLSMAASSADGPRAKALWGAGWLAFAQGDYEEAEALSAELVDVAHKQGAKIDERNALTVLGMILLARGRSEEALEPFERGLEICLDLGPSWHLATSHLNLGMAQMHAGHLREAEGLITRAREIYSDIGDQHFEARCVAYLGYVALLAGETARAGSLFAASLERFGELEDLQGIAEGLEGLAAVNAAAKSRDRALRAGRLAGAASSIRERLTAKQYPFDQTGMEPFLAKARTALGAARWEQAWEEGRELTMERVFGLALQHA